MNKPSAVAVTRNALDTIKQLFGLLDAAKEGYTAQEFETLQKAVGIFIGEMQVQILDPIYEQFPELSDLQVRH